MIRLSRFLSIASHRLCTVTFVREEKNAYAIDVLYKFLQLNFMGLVELITFFGIYSTTKR